VDSCASLQIACSIALCAAPQSKLAAWADRDSNPAMKSAVRTMKAEMRRYGMWCVRSCFESVCLVGITKWHRRFSSIFAPLPTARKWPEASGTISTARMEEAGLDGVEVLAGAGYLFSQFFSPVLNQRTDVYGGSFANGSGRCSKRFDRVAILVHN
jgi:hypothetical protein